MAVLSVPGAPSGPVSELLAGLALVDQHCHGIVTADLDRPRFEALISEGGPPAAGVSNLDAPVGTAIRRHCAPVLDLERHAGGEAYVDRRAELGWPEVHRRLLAAAGTAEFYVDTGFAPDDVTTPHQLAAAGGGPGREVLRLEVVAEQVAAGGVEPGEYASGVVQAAAAAVADRRAVGCKSIAAYRTGFRLDPRPPSADEVATAAASWLARGRSGVPAGVRDPVLVRHLLWTAVELGLPLQLHTGFGDSDIRMPDVDPTHLTDWLHLVGGAIPVVLLHCWPYQRQAAYLAAVFEQVHLDVGLTLHYVGPARASAILAEALEVTPFHKLLYSSDAYGVAEFHLLGAVAFRRGLGELLDRRVADDDIALDDALRLARWVARDNAHRVYRTGPKVADR